MKRFPSPDSTTLAGNGTSLSARGRVIRALLCSALLLASVLLSSCTILTSSELGTGSKAAGYYALPMGLVHIKVISDENKNYGLEYVGTEYVPDPHMIVALEYIKCASAEDEVNIKISREGFLKSVKAVSEEKSAKIVAKVVELAKEVVKAVAPYPGARVPEEKKRDVLVVKFDPTDEDELKRVDESVQEYGFHLECDPLDSKSIPEHKISGASTITGICFRPLKPYRFVVKGNTSPPYIPYAKDASKTKTLLEEVVLLPNEGPVFSIDVTRAAFVKKETELTFEDGFLTSVRIKKPSEILGLVEIPLNAVKEIVSLPTELIQLKVDTTKKSKELFEARKDYFDAKKAELEAREELLKLKDEQLKKNSKNGSGSGDPYKDSPPLKEEEE